MAKCVVSACPNRVVNVTFNRGVLNRPPKRFFSFPKDPAQVKVWLMALRETDKQDSTEHHLICEDHFQLEDISTDGVKSGAIPIGPPCPDTINPQGAESSEENDEEVTSGDDDDDSDYDDDADDSDYNVDDDDEDNPASDGGDDDPAQQDAEAKKTSGGETTGLQKETIQTKGVHRQGASLKVLTQSFLGLMQAAPGCLLDLDCVTTSLKTCRRRVYDITNVLKGMLLIKKESANMYKWTGKTPISSFLQTNKQNLEAELENLKLGEEILDSLITSCTQQVCEMNEDNENAALAYLTYEDVSRLSAFQEQTVIVVKAPADTTLEVPAPKEGGIQIHIKGGLGPIKVLACDTGTGDVTGENGGCFLTLEESRIKTHSLYEDSELANKVLIKQERDVEDNAVDYLILGQTVKIEDMDGDEGYRPGPSTSITSPTFQFQQSCSTPQMCEPVPQPQCPFPESAPLQPSEAEEDEDEEEEEEEEDEDYMEMDDDDNDDDYVEDEDYTDMDDDVEDEEYTPCPSPSPKKRRLSKSATSRVRQEEDGHEDRWHNKEERDKRPDPLRFTPTRTPGPTFDTTSSWSPLSLFQLFFSTSVVRTIIANTNANAAKRKLAGYKFVWKPLTVKDFYIFLSIIIYSGLVKVHTRSDFWRKEWPYNFRFPGDTMTRCRFESILWSLHMSDPAEDEENDRKKNTAEYDRLFKIKPLYTEMVNACKVHFQPYRNISIDERMVATRARISMKQYMKAKPTKWGYKLFVLADSLTSYTWNFFIYDGKSRNNQDKGLSYTSVMDLLQFPVLGRGYTLFVDNFYSSVDLFEELSRQNIGVCGTIRRNRIGFPKTTENDLPKKPERGDMRWIRQNKLLFVKWMDTREVTMCSTVHEAFSGQTVKRRVRKAGVWQIKDVPVPDVVLKYNQSMGGVDVSDALIGYYTVHHKTMKWYKTFFYHFIDIAVVNSFILHKELFKMKNHPNMKKPFTHKVFRETLASEMLKFAKASEPPPQTQPVTSCMPAYYGEDGTQVRRYCKQCQEAGIKRVKTPVYCMGCQVPLCLTSKRNCFMEWHQKSA